MLLCGLFMLNKQVSGTISAAVVKAESTLSEDVFLLMSEITV